MQHEVLLVSALQRIDELLVLAGTQGRDDQGLRFAAGEKGSAMRARKNADFETIGRTVLRSLPSIR